MVELTWTLEQVAEAQNVFEEAGGANDDPSCPLRQYVGLHHLEDEKEAVRRGEDGAILRAIHHCAYYRLLMPEWLRDTYLEQYLRTRNFDFASWDEAFGRPHPKGAHVAKTYKKRIMKFTVWCRVQHLRKSVPVGDELFARVGEEFGLSKTVCNELYYDACRYLKRRLPEKET